MYKFDYLKPIQIGNQVAENDWEVLKEHFVPIGTSHFVGKADTSLLLGRKGAGKSALRLHFERTNKPSAVSLQPSSEDLQSIYEYLVDHGNTIFAVEPLEILWEIAVLLNLARLCRNADRPLSNPVIPDGIASDINAGQRFGLGRTLTLLKDVFKTNKERSDLIRYLRDYLDKEMPQPPYFVLIDSVDDLLHNSFDTSKRNDLFATFLESLVNFCRNFANNERNKLANRVFLQVFIPLDLYNWCMDRHADHLRQYKHMVRWSFDHLNQFAALRLADNIRPAQRPKERDEVWKVFFPDTVQFTGYRPTGERFAVEIPTHEAFISMTLMRPRDLQEIIRQVDLQTKSANLLFPSGEVIKKALQAYSVELYESVISEYGTAFPQLREVLSRFAYNNAIVPKSVAYDLVGRVVGHQETPIRGALATLYEAGVLGVTNSERHGLDDETYYSHTFENYDTVYQSRFFIVHRAFWHALRVDSLSARPERNGA